MTNDILENDSDKCFGLTVTKLTLQTSQDRGSYLCLVTAELLTTDYVRYVVGTINLLVIGLENSRHIVTKLSKEKATKVKVTGSKRKSTKLDLVDMVLIGYNGVPAPIANQLTYSNKPHCIVLQGIEYVNTL